MYRRTLQSPLGVLVMAQAAIQHSDPSLAANVCTDPKLLDVAGAWASLPDLPLGEVGERTAAVASH